MGSDSPTAALVALLEQVPAVASRERGRLRERGGAQAILERELGLFADAAIADAAGRLEGWRSRGWSVVSIGADAYPRLLGETAEAPPLLFIAGRLPPDEQPAVSVVGSRAPTRQGCALAAEVARLLARAGYCVVSGLAAGIDTVVHRTALDAGAPTVAVIGNGLEYSYPADNAGLQRQIAATGAVVSQFLPSTRPSRHSFPLRNAAMSGLTTATVIVEASATSGTRVQARSALSQGRRLLLMRGLLVNEWARELVGRPGVEVLDDGAAVIDALKQPLAVAA